MALAPIPRHVMEYDDDDDGDQDDDCFAQMVRRATFFPDPILVHHLDESNTLLLRLTF
jgi:hypothetical protein